MQDTEMLDADAEDPASPSTEVAKLYAEILNQTADLSGKLNDLMDEIAKLAFKVKKTDKNEGIRLQTLRDQIKRADDAILDVGVGIL